MIKCTNGFNWILIDRERGFAADDLTYKLYANKGDTTNADSRGAETRIKFTSNGFRFLDNQAEANDPSRSYVYAAFAHKPF